MRHGLQLPQERVVVGVRADPEPHKGVTVAHRESAVTEPDAGGVDRAGGVNLLEAEARTGRVIPAVGAR